jgi:hypothetical protein
MRVLRVECSNELGRLGGLKVRWKVENSVGVGGDGRSRFSQ